MDQRQPFQFEQHRALTPRERDVALALLGGLSVKEIGGSLNVGTDTARMHIKHAHRKVGSQNLHSLALWSSKHRVCCLHDIELTTTHNWGSSPSHLG